jgi:hypothetical protein
MIKGAHRDARAAPDYKRLEQRRKSGADSRTSCPSGSLPLLPKLFSPTRRSSVQAEMSAMRVLLKLLRFLLVIVEVRASPPRYLSSFALIVICALSTFDTGHPALAFSAAF